METLKYDYSRLRGRIVEKYGTMSHFADVARLTRVSVSNRVTGKISFTVEDIDKWAKLLDIADSDYPQYFFAKNVSPTVTLDATTETVETET